MDRILKIQKKENGPRASSAPALELNTIIFIHVYWYMQQISGERLQDHWSSGFMAVSFDCLSIYMRKTIKQLQSPIHLHEENYETLYGKVSFDRLLIYMRKILKPSIHKQMNEVLVFMKFNYAVAE